MQIYPLDGAFCPDSEYELFFVICLYFDRENCEIPSNFWRISYVEQLETNCFDHDLRIVL